MLIAELKDFPFNKKDLSYVVVSFDIIAYSAKGRAYYPTVEKTGGRFNDDVMKAIDNTPSNSTITFTNIVAKRRGTKGLKKEILNDLVYTLK